MDREDIIRMAREAEFEVYETDVWITDGWWLEELERFAALVAAAERIRVNYAKKIKEVNRDRFQIIKDFRQSIGAITPKSDLAFYKLFKLVKDAGDLEFNATAMK